MKERTKNTAATAAKPALKHIAPGLSSNECEDLRREIMREMSCRARVYPGLIRDGRLTEQEAHDRCRALSLGIHAADILVRAHEGATAADAEAYRGAK